MKLTGWGGYPVIEGNITTPETLDELLKQIQHENFYRVYPHKAFCNNIILSKCVFSDGSKLFVVIIIIRHHMVLGSYMKKYLLWLRSWNIKSKQVFVSVFKNNSNCPNSLVFVHPWVS